MDGWRAGRHLILVDGGQAGPSFRWMEGRQGPFSAVDEGQGRTGGRGTFMKYRIIVHEMLEHEIVVEATSYFEACSKAFHAITESTTPVEDGLAVSYSVESKGTEIDPVYASYSVEK